MSTINATLLGDLYTYVHACSIRNWYHLRIFQNVLVRAYILKKYDLIIQTSVFFYVNTDNTSKCILTKRLLKIKFEN